MKDLITTIDLDDNDEFENSALEQLSGNNRDSEESDEPDDDDSEKSDQEESDSEDSSGLFNFESDQEIIEDPEEKTRICQEMAEESARFDQENGKKEKDEAELEEKIEKWKDITDIVKEMTSDQKQIFKRLIEESIKYVSEDSDSKEIDSKKSDSKGSSSEESDS